MTDKPYILGRGRLYFGDRLLGEVIPDPEDPVTLMRKRETTFTATCEIKDWQFPRWMQTITTAAAVGYNPQRLLTDQRTPEKKQADDMVAAYRKAFPAMAAFWDQPITGHEFADFYRPIPHIFPGDKIELSSLYHGDLGETYEPNGEFEPPKWHEGGTVTGRWRGGRLETHWPVMRPSGEHVLPKDHPMVAIDYGKIEARVLSSMSITKTITADLSNFTAGLETATRAMRRMSKSMEAVAARLNEQASRSWDRRMLAAIYGEGVMGAPEERSSRERRIYKLMYSPDRRQRKRGERLFISWRRERQRAKVRGYRDGYSNHYRKD